MQRQGELGITLIVLVALAVIVLVLLAGNVVLSGEKLNFVLSDCEQNTGICKNECAPNGRALPYACGEENTCCVLSAERGTPFITY